MGFAISVTNQLAINNIVAKDNGNEKTDVFLINCVYVLATRTYAFPYVTVSYSPTHTAAVYGYCLRDF